ncbi:MAG: nicotinate (nicotinamide) nucleotide adenylyltransferase [Eubacteriales bacterium]|nr:nicotinate (nicotinamide) nucleotide adenylyltransferase [Eubacteriales bacterium]
MERIGIYGGTFNPPHIGHIQAARSAMETLGLDRLLLIPVSDAPHKTLPPNSPAPAQRLQMLAIAAAALPGAEVSDLELRREGVSYTYETVLDLKKMHPAAELVLLMGTDMFLRFETWVHPEIIQENVTLAVFCRGDRGEREAIAREKAAMEARVELVDHEPVAISSTQLRRLLAFHCADDFLPRGVGEYIAREGLYDTAAHWKNLPMDKLEQVVVGLLKPSRVAHVLGCRDTALALARHWGADETDAARAGLLHDITKALDGPLQLTLCSSYGKILGDFARKYPKTLHALTGSLVAERIFGENKAVVAAIESHTTGKPNMNLLEAIIYVADYMEPNRDFPGVEQLRRLAFEDIYAALDLGLHMTLDHLARQGSEVSPETRQTLQWLNSRT